MNVPLGLEALLTVTRYLGDRYGVQVSLVNQKPIFDGVAELRDRRVVIDISSRGIEGSVFILAHIFGHIVQAATTRKYDAMLARVYEKPAPITPGLVDQGEYFDYEREAYALGLGMLDKVLSFDQGVEGRYQVFMLTDLEHYWHYLTTGERGSQRDFNDLFARKMVTEYQGLSFPMVRIEPPSTLPSHWVREFTVR